MRTHSALWGPHLKWRARCLMGTSRRGNCHSARPTLGAAIQRSKIAPRPSRGQKSGVPRSYGGSPIPGRAGYPPSVVTDAHLGYSVMAYQHGANVFGSREGASRSLVRIEGTCARVNPEGGSGSAKCAKAGYCLYCARSTQIAAPTRYDVGAPVPGKARGFSLRIEHGPWAARYYVA